MKPSDLHQRRDRILALLAEHGELSASDLSGQLGVSVQTIRTDLRGLDEAALVQRRNGVARIRQQAENIAYSPRLSASRLEKQRIAQRVQGLVSDGDRIALGTGTTVVHCARLLANRQNLFVVTNSMHAVIALQHAPGARVEMAGGQVRLRDLDFVSATSWQFFDSFRVDTAIFSCGGVSENGDVLDFNSDEIAVRKAIAACAKKTVLVADSAKFGRDLPCRSGSVSDYDVFVSAASLSETLQEKCDHANCRILPAETSGSS